ncbi:hypothetical protein CVT24_013140 [Panaeolus cyanescens]|uniref:Uncharacterized protein n=1 Tax=Panaeolus cyanescens TaxID=181874 RepID=A0A409VVW1_9AGAR|nr:hypothetical protein CVT24_013140 [Panaeolus cyanescens]
MSALPLRIRIAIRDEWDDPKSVLASKVAELKTKLGYEIVPGLSTNWENFYKVLLPYYNTPGTDNIHVVSRISEYAELFYETLSQLVDSRDLDDKWIKSLLGALGTGAEACRLTLDIADIEGPRPYLSWVPGDGGFWMSIPRSPPAPKSVVVTGFQDDLLAPNFFYEEDEIPDHHTPVQSGERKWVKTDIADGKGDPSGLEGSASVPDISRMHVSSQPERGGATKRHLPAVKSLNRPLSLFKETAPYVMIVETTTSPLVVECSHQPSLELLADYLKTWGRQNPSDSLKRSFLKVELHESLFFAGLVDELTVEPFYSTANQKRPINPTIILAFIEGVLGFRETHTTGKRWVYKMDVIVDQ